MYCVECHGRGLDNHDELCRNCHGSGYEPERFEVDDEIAALIAELELEELAN